MVLSNRSVLAAALSLAVAAAKKKKAVKVEVPPLPSTAFAPLTGMAYGGAAALVLLAVAIVTTLIFRGQSKSAGGGSKVDWDKVKADEAAATAAAAAAAAAPVEPPEPPVVSPFNEQKTRRFRRMFDKYDRDSSKTIDEAELATLFKDCGRDASHDKIRELLKKHCPAGTKDFAFGPFLNMVKDLEQNENFFDYISYKFNSSNDLSALLTQ